jgi:hypothetical protein
VSPRRLGIHIWGVALHLFFAVVGWAVSFGLALAIYGLLLHPHAEDLYSSSSILNPLFWMPSLFVGLIINRFVRQDWAWLAPAAIGISIMIGVILWDVSLFRHSAYEIGLAHGHVWKYELGRLFSPVSSFSPGKADRSLTQLFLTFPFLSSVAYSVGAWLALRFGRCEPVHATSTAK